MVNWKSYLKMVLAALLPISYQLFIKNNPSFPLSETQWIDTILWIIGAAVGGWEAMKIKMNYLARKKV